MQKTSYYISFSDLLLSFKLKELVTLVLLWTLIFLIFLKFVTITFKGYIKQNFSLLNNNCPSYSPACKGNNLNVYKKFYLGWTIIWSAPAMKFILVYTSKFTFYFNLLAILKVWVYSFSVSHSIIIKGLSVQGSSGKPIKL